jgi:methylthioribose-1-phosphate isomerase
MTEFQPVAWVNGKVRYLDQRKLPAAVTHVETDDERVIADAIRSLAIRGAPLIGIAAAYGVTLAAKKARDENPATIPSVINRTIALLSGTRPTAVNLFWALERMQNVFAASSKSSVDDILDALIREAQSIHEEDEAMCRRIGELGASLLPNAVCVLTHCNTGRLATGGNGTAQSVISRAWEQHKLKHVYIDETRPLLQGARLTAWELQQLGIPSTLITDNTAAFLMQRGLVNAVVVGADRIVANGDVANKVGTYGLAVLAKYHEIPFYVAAPTSTFDAKTKSGKSIPIEQRSADEVTMLNGVRLAPEGVEVYSPAFDITPHELISAIVTEKGVHTAPFEVSLKQSKESA